MSGAQIWRISAVRGMLALRRWPLEHPTPERLGFVHAVLAHAARRNIGFVPAPICATTGETFVQHAGYLWELAPWMPGAANYGQSPSIPKLQAAMRALAAFHMAVADFGGGLSPPGGAYEGASLAAIRVSTSPAVSRRLAQLRDLGEGGTRELTLAISSTRWPDLAPLARRFVATLPSAATRAIAQLAPLADVRFRLQPCLRDIWHDHVLFTNEEVTGIVDFGAMDVDTPACDVARLLGSLVGDDAAGWQTGTGAYRAVHRLSTDETRAVAAFDVSGTVLAGCNWIRWIYMDGREFENRDHVIERFRRIVDRIVLGL